MTITGPIYPEGFEWDWAKSLSNMEKHGIDFEDASLTFDQYVHSEVDDRFDYGEVRQIGYGRLDDEILVVVYTMRGTVRRIISARRARRDERERYRNAEAARQEDGQD